LIYGVISARLAALGIETSARIQPLHLHARKQPEPGPHSHGSLYSGKVGPSSFGCLPRRLCMVYAPTAARRQRSPPRSCVPFPLKPYLSPPLCAGKYLGTCALVLRFERPSTYNKTLSITFTPTRRKTERQSRKVES
jgi:hypothetical protein